MLALTVSSPFCPHHFPHTEVSPTGYKDGLDKNGQDSPEQQVGCLHLVFTFETVKPESRGQDRKLSKLGEIIYCGHYHSLA
ncbi:hypothetical protein U0070_018418 [Myodes glareolus]|uniref:Uncharacterized protein n=1 Tax=Myodes glareolus TaxID=447135 RepID=A0AAW0JVZ0_MYOGA